MTEHRATSRPACPFCHVEWTEAMMAQYDLYAMDGPCACCSGPHEAADAEPLPEMPTEDLCCASCGRAIFLKPPVTDRHEH